MDKVKEFVDSLFSGKSSQEINLILDKAGLLSTLTEQEVRSLVDPKIWEYQTERNQLRIALALSLNS